MAKQPRNAPVHCLPEQELLRLARRGQRQVPAGTTPDPKTSSRPEKQGWEDVEAILGLNLQPKTP
ncbi:MAG: hypothetical protein ACOYEW_09380 [Anaerolineae bacterium]|jgi:hypothetical protein